MFKFPFSFLTIFIYVWVKIEIKLLSASLLYSTYSPQTKPIIRLIKNVRIPMLNFSVAADLFSPAFHTKLFNLTSLISLFPSFISCCYYLYYIIIIIINFVFCCKIVQSTIKILVGWIAIELQLLCNSETKHKNIISCSIIFFFAFLFLF